MQRGDAPISVDVRDVDIGDVHHAEPSAVSTPPGMEPVTGSERKPAEAAPSAKTDIETEASTPAPEGDICGRPERVIAGPNWSRPPGPRRTIGKPATVVIRRPTPRLITYPSPAVASFPNPVAVAIRNPAIRFVRHPHVTVVLHLFPTAVGIQVMSSGVITVRVMP